MLTRHYPERNKSILDPIVFDKDLSVADQMKKLAVSLWEWRSGVKLSFSKELADLDKKLKINMSYVQRVIGGSSQITFRYTWRVLSEGGISIKGQDTLAYINEKILDLLTSLQEAGEFDFELRSAAKLVWKNRLKDWFGFIPSSLADQYLADLTVTNIRNRCHLILLLLGKFPSIAQFHRYKTLFALFFLPNLKTDGEQYFSWRSDILPAATLAAQTFNCSRLMETLSELDLSLSAKDVVELALDPEMPIAFILV